jgi:hypothetical protein
MMASAWDVRNSRRAGMAGSRVGTGGGLPLSLTDPTCSDTHWGPTCVQRDVDTNPATSLVSQGPAQHRVSCRTASNSASPDVCRRSNTAGTERSFLVT